jgi:hypothetical protein
MVMQLYALIRATDLEIGADDFLALLASVGKQRFVAFDAERLLVA